LLFNSYEFIFVFFPLCVLGYYLCTRFLSLEYALSFLVAASLCFYAYWKPVYLLLILFSITFNFIIGRLLADPGRSGLKGIMIFGVCVNLAALGYFKYANFFVDNVNQLAGTNWNLEKIFLPLAISFFTFQQISYLVDTYRGKTSEHSFLHYALFVCFFPQLIAGPIVHHKEILPQFVNKTTMRLCSSNVAIGLSIFAIGLFKKTVLADNLAVYVWPVYDSPEGAANVDFFRAWSSTLAYTFQLYFDFSGYSDMAIGAARVFGVRLPLNFFSPLKSMSIVEMWRRWHITLSRFLREYLYIALGGNRSGTVRRYFNLFMTFLLGGLWHGAGWHFLAWGALMGGFVVFNHGWRNMLQALGLALDAKIYYKAFCWVVTFTAWVFSLVFFRAHNMDDVASISKAMLGLSGFELPAGVLVRLGSMGEYLTSGLGVQATHGGGQVLLSSVLWIIVGAVVALGFPNVAQIFHRHNPVVYEDDRTFAGLRETGLLAWNYQTAWAITVAIAGVAGVMTLQQVSEFLYFQF
jgi:alginate O-acetyltransferase complex protein AlgI